MGHVDLTIFSALNGLVGRNQAFDRAVAWFTTYVPFLLLLLLAVAFVIPGPGAAGRRRAAVVAGLAGVIGVLIAVLIGQMVFRPRPFAALPTERVRPLIHHAPDSSFPSDHATGSSAMAAGMWASGTRLWRVVFATVAVLAGLSRVIAGVHWPGDVLGSFIIGVLTGAVTVYAAKPLMPLIDRVILWYGRLERLWLRKSE
ncbi:MAG TPA: phosphatase PAP2 family protein [Bacillota bacterium]|jgi:undecaprenyl-diphosphatase